MLTDQDIQKLQEMLATKKDLEDLQLHTDTRFDGVDNKFEAIDKRFDGVDNKFEAIDKRFDGVDNRFEAIDKRFDGVDNRFEAIDKRFDGVDSEIAGLRDYTKQEFQNVHESISSLREVVQGLSVSVDGLARAVEDFRIEYAAITTRTDRLERWVKQIAGKVGVNLEM